MGELTVPSIPSIRWPTLEEVGTFRKSYDRRRDVLFIYRVPKVEATSFSLDDEGWIRITEDGEVVGFEIEDFENVFLVKHPELRPAWNELKPTIVKRVMRETESPDAVRAFLLSLTTGLKRFLDSHPQQLGFAG